MHAAHPFQPIGNLVQLAAVAASAVFGYAAMPVIPSILVGSVLLSVGYMLVRLPQMINLYQTERKRILLLPIYLVVFNCALSAPLFGIGWVFS